jgi:peptidylprolyl isomerase
MNRRTHRVIAAALVAVLPLGATACGDEEDSADTSESTTTTTAAGEDFLAQIEERGKPTLEATEPVTELVVTDEVEGTGTEVQAGDTVTAHYVGVSASTGEEFDASWTGGQPISFPLDGVIAGWSEGLVGMKEGGRRTLVIPADLAYGDTPPPQSGIAPGETLVFTVDLVAVN